MTYAIAAITAVAAAYQLLAILACVFRAPWGRHSCLPSLFRSEGQTGKNACPTGPVSILKPVHGLHPGFYEALASHARQDYPEFELLLGYSNPNEPALAEINRAIADFPSVDIRALQCRQAAPNQKVGVLMDLAKQARYPILIVNDADIAVPVNYLREVAAPLADPAIGLVTCIYRAHGDSWPARFEALGVATDFAPSALVAPFVGVSEFGLGSTLAFRRGDLDRTGGFAAVADYLADDYQLGCKLHGLGLRNIISPIVVSTRLDSAAWAGVWRHQLRWARTIRISRTGGYAGLPVTFATVWAIAAACAGVWWAAILLIAARLIMAIVAGWFVVRSPDVLKLCWLVPVRDLFAAVVWAAALFGNTVEWGGETLKIDAQGRIVR